MKAIRAWALVVSGENRFFSPGSDYRIFSSKSSAKLYSENKIISKRYCEVIEVEIRPLTRKRKGREK